MCKKDVSLKYAVQQDILLSDMKPEHTTTKT